MSSSDPSSSTLRHRPSGVASNDSAKRTTTTPPLVETSVEGTSSALDAQLLEARQRMAQRVREQMKNDGWVDGEEPEQGAEVAHGEEEACVTSKAEERHVSDDEVEDLLKKTLSASLPASSEGGDGAGDARPPLETEEPKGEAAPPEQDDGVGDDKMCRICFDGEDPDLGRLFSPCLCRGTSRYVHVACLDRWRAASAGHTAFYKCDQCGYEYKLRRTKIAGLAQNRFAIMGLTVFSFAILIFLAGFIATWMIDVAEARAERLRNYPSPFEDLFVSDSVILGEGVLEAVSFFGQTVDKAGLLGSQKYDPRADAQEESSGGYYWSTPQKKAKRRVRQKPPLLYRTAQHFIKGFSLVGLASFFHMFVATAFFGPFGIRGSLFRAVRPNRRNGDNQTSFSQIVIVMFVLLGAVKAVQQVYKGVRWTSRRMLKRVEGLVMDV